MKLFQLLPKKLYDFACNLPALAVELAIVNNDQEALVVARFLLEHGANPDKSPDSYEGETMLQGTIFKKNLPAWNSCWSMAQV